MIDFLVSSFTVAGFSGGVFPVEPLQAFCCYVARNVATKSNIASIAATLQQSQPQPQPLPPIN